MRIRIIETASGRRYQPDGLDDPTDEKGRTEETDIVQVDTKCCALSQLSMGNRVRRPFLLGVLAYLKREAASQNRFNGAWGGQTTFFTITVAPGESQLEETLKGVGFKMMSVFPRRKGYPPGVCHMWQISVAELPQA